MFSRDGFKGTPDALLTSLKTTTDPIIGSVGGAGETTSAQTINGVNWTVYYEGANKAWLAATEQLGLTYFIYFVSGSGQPDQDYQQLFLPVLNTIKLSIPAAPAPAAGGQSF
jgi:hypothetical protein